MLPSPSTFGIKWIKFLDGSWNHSYREHTAATIASEFDRKT